MCLVIIFFTKVTCTTLLVLHSKNIEFIIKACISCVFHLRFQLRVRRWVCQMGGVWCSRQTDTQPPPCSPVGNTTLSRASKPWPAGTMAPGTIFNLSVVSRWKQCGKLVKNLKNEEKFYIEIMFYNDY